MDHNNFGNISKNWKIALSVLISIFIILESFRFYFRLSNIEVFGINNLIIHGTIIALLLTMLILTLIGKRSAALFTIFVIAFNILVVTVYPYNISNSHNMLYDRMVFETQYLFSMPEPLFYFYLLVQFVLVWAIGTYYFSEYLFNEYLCTIRTPRQIEFESLLKEALHEMELKKA